MSDRNMEQFTEHDVLQWLERPELAERWFRVCRLENRRRGHDNLVKLASTGIPIDLMTALCRKMAEVLPRLSDPDMALNNFERFVASTRSPLSLASLLDRDEEALDVLLRIFSASQHQSDVLIQEPESFDLVRLTEGKPVARDILVRELVSEIDVAGADIKSAAVLLRRCKRRETLRVAYGDLIRGQSLDTVTRQISYLADALCSASLQAALNHYATAHGTPLGKDGKPARLVVLGLGKLGGVELNYSSDIDLILVYDRDGRTSGPRAVSNQEFYEKVTRQFVKLLSEATELGMVYRVDLRLRPQGAQGPIVTSEASAMHYYDILGRTWERQAFVKARPIAGDMAYGQEFLGKMESWVYRRYLTRADISGIRALKRRIEKRAIREGADLSDVKCGHGGIRDIEFAIQFLQLLNGGDLPQIRTGNTLEAIAALETTGCLTIQEAQLLEKNYIFLRKIEHHLQIMFDLQTHRLPTAPDEMRKLALRMGFEDSSAKGALESFAAEYQDTTRVNRQILSHLLTDAFGDEGETAPEVDVVLDPEPPETFVKSVLLPHGFTDWRSAYKNLTALGVEQIPFLSTRRCRHFLAAIAPRLLEAVANTPDPDATLVDLSRISDSVGGKGILWELFSVSEASLQLYVRLCAACPYLSGMLTSHPGMIDELMDSLVLDRLPTRKSLQLGLNQLCRGAEDLEPILHSFKNSNQLRVGVRDILGKEDIRRTTATLADIAELCVQQVVLREYDKLTERYGVPGVDGGVDLLDDGTDVSVERYAQLPGEEDLCQLVILALGKLGGREPNYHSDLDIVFIYQADGKTRTTSRSRGRESTTNQHFFSELGQRVIRAVNRLGPYGRLYELDARLRPTGRSGALAVSLDEFNRYFEEGRGDLWERQALCKARPIFGSQKARYQVMREVHRAIVEPGWSDENASSIHTMRGRMEETASKANLKRGPGGTVDVEFTVQMLQLRHALEFSQVLLPGTLEAIDALRENQLFAREDADYFSMSYRFLRSVEARLRLMNTTARHDLPQEASELRKLAYLLEMTPAELTEKCRYYTEENRRRFDRIFQEMTV
jgi:glutamate-ammonia-ligase adenylyltransferase